MTEEYEYRRELRDERSRSRASWDSDWDDDESRPIRRRSSGFRCPYCGTSEYPIVYRQISTAGWAVFIAMLFICLPMFWVGLLITEEKRRCAGCGIPFG